MHQTKYLWFYIAGLLFVPACIEQYKPIIETQDSKKYVVSGNITDKEGYQYVTISLASRIDKPSFIPLNSCIVTISDDSNNSFTLEEYEDGHYRVWIAEEYLSPGKSYQLNVLTPAGVQISSDYDKMPACPNIEKLYFEYENKLTNDPDKSLLGIQFYIDIDASDTESSYFRWELEETWEYRTEYPIERYYDGTHHFIEPPDYSKNVCWKSKRIEDIYTLSLENITQNSYKMLPLHFVDNKTERLKHCYSILLHQFALSEEAFNYWEQMSKNSSSQGGMYEKQPITVKGNLRSISNPEFEVLGLFSASSIKSERIFVKNIDIELDYPNYCLPINILEFKGFEDFDPASYPIYYYIDDETIGIVDQCVDCLILGGINIKPEYWPE